MSTITRERLLKIQQWRETYGPGSNVVLPAEEAEELACIALASLEAEPVAWRCGSTVTVNKPVADDWKRRGFDFYPLFTAPPTPVSVPDEQYSERFNWTLGKWAEHVGGHYHGNDPANYYEFSSFMAVAAMLSQFGTVQQMLGWNACRAAMLQGKTEPRNDVRQEHAEWSQSTFGDVGPVGPLKHLSKEALEAAEEPDDLSEWADMQFLLWDAQRRAGITDEQITQAMIDKLAVNKSRQWPEPKDGEPRLHIKAAPKQENI